MAKPWGELNWVCFSLMERKPVHSPLRVQPTQDENISDPSRKLWGRCRVCITWSLRDSPGTGDLSESVWSRSGLLVSPGEHRESPVGNPRPHPEGQPSLTPHTDLLSPLTQLGQTRNQGWECGWRGASGYRHSNEVSALCNLLGPSPRTS